MVRTNTRVMGSARSGSVWSRFRVGHALRAGNLRVDYGATNVQDAEVVPGILPATDPFFAFITQGGGAKNFVHPPLPPHVLRTIKMKELRYQFHDTLSREPSFEPLEEDEYECKCHQVTDLSAVAQVRERIPVTPEYVDDVGLILGDTWWPGASGSRFIYEVSTPNPDFFLNEGTVPCAQLLFVYTTRKQKKGEILEAYAMLEEQAEDESDEEAHHKKAEEEDYEMEGHKVRLADVQRMRRHMSLPVPIAAFL